MKTALPEMALIEYFTAGKGGYWRLHSRKGRLLKTTLPEGRLLKTSLPERAVIEDFTPGKGGY